MLSNICYGIINDGHIILYTILIYIFCVMKYKFNSLINILGKNMMRLPSLLLIVRIISFLSAFRVTLYHHIFIQSRQIIVNNNPLLMVV